MQGPSTCIVCSYGTCERRDQGAACKWHLCRPMCLSCEDKWWKTTKEHRAEFKALPCTSGSYEGQDGILASQELAAFSAAGVFLWRRLGELEPEVLMAWEDRGNNRLLNFLGGRRDRKEETPWDVAAREVCEETGEMLSLSSIKKGGNRAFWMHGKDKSRYVLFVHELVEPAGQDVVKKFNTLPKLASGGPLEKDPWIISLEWVPESTVKKNHPKIFHSFVCGMIKVLLKAQVSVFQTRRTTDPLDDDDDEQLDDDDDDRLEQMVRLLLGDGSD